MTAESCFPVVDGWLQRVHRCPSPNFNARPTNEISLLVIHNISLPPGVYGGDAIVRFFCNQLPAHEHPYFQEIAALQVSAHLLINRQGEVWQFVAFTDRAWHAGQSAFVGRSNCNDFAIGIELEGSDHEAFTPAQYRQLVAITQGLMATYPAITPARICGHDAIAPGRKTDPGPAFDWDYYRSLLA